MFNRTVTVRSSIIVTLGAVAISACDGLPTSPQNSDETADLAVAAMALEDADIDHGTDAAWRVDLELEAASHIRITVPAGIAAIERRDAAKRVDGVHLGQPDMLARRAAPVAFTPPGRDGLELSLFNDVTGELVAKTVVEDEREALIVELEDPCAPRRRCDLSLRLEARWLGRDAVRVSPDFEIESALGRIHASGDVAQAARR